MRRKYFGSVKVKSYGGRDVNKTLGIHMAADDKQAIRFASSILKAIEYGKDIDITVFKDIRGAKVQITITSKI